MDVYGVFWFNPWTFAIYAGRFNIMSTNWNTRKQGAWSSSPAILPCFWNANGSEMTLKWLFDLVFKLSNPYILQPAPLPPTSTACTAATQKITLDQPMVLRPPYGGLHGSQWSNMKTQVETHIGTQNAPLKLQIAPEIWPCHKSAFFRVHVSFLLVLIYYFWTPNSR